MNGKPWVVIAVVVVALGGLGFTMFRPSYFPNVAAASDADPVTIDQMRGERPSLVLAMVAPGDPVSKAALTRLSEAYEKAEQRASFAALTFGAPAQAAAWQKELQLPFPVYSVSPAANPVEYNEIVKTLGGSAIVSTWARWWCSPRRGGSRSRSTGMSSRISRAR